MIPDEQNSRSKMKLYSLESTSQPSIHEIMMMMITQHFVVVVVYHFIISIQPTAAFRLMRKMDQIVML